MSGAAPGLTLPASECRPIVAAERPWAMPLWQVWLLVSAGFLLLTAPQIVRLRLPEPDDYMRLLEVRDWLAGQSWFDLRQHRMEFPIGADMHWSRLVDVPIAAAILLFDLVLPAAVAERAGLAVTPLLELLLAMVLLRELLRTVGAADRVVLAAIAIVPLFPLLTYNFLPLRIDHHAWQALAALAVAWLMLRGGWRRAFAAGAVGALWLDISLEGLPLVAVFGGLYALRYWLHGRRDHEGFLLGLALAGPVLFLLTRPADTFAAAMCDVPSWPHFVALGAAAALAVASRVLPGQRWPLGRLASLAPIAPTAAVLTIVPLGACALSPMAELDPVLKHYWFENLAESAPLTSQTPSVAAILLWTIAVVVAGGRLAWDQAEDADARERWLLLATAALAAGLLSLWCMRVGIAAELLTVPFAAVLLTHILPRARAVPKLLPRVAATVGCFALATPTFAGGLLKPFDRQDPMILAEPPTKSGWKSCDFAPLAALPRATLFAPLDAGPEILVRTDHRVIMGGYHRNQRVMRMVFDAFSGPLADARRAVLASGADYVVACTSTCDTAVYARMGMGNLASLLLAGTPPGWLEPVPGFAQGRLKVWRVRR